MNAGGAQFGEVDLTSCDREPIHIPGSIQPHGLLLVVDRQDLAIRQFAGDTRFLLGIEPGRLPQLTLYSLFDEPLLAPLAERLGASAPEVRPTVFLGLTSRTGPLPLDATVHAQGAVGIVELEPARRSSAATGDPLSQVKAMLAALHSADGFEAFCAAAAVQLRAATGFDRAMVYQFLHDGSGAVVAEDRADGLDSYLGLHYPASDIPLQARELYRRNWLRLVPDAGYTPALLTPGSAGRLEQPLDMSQCALRSVSPIHLEYLRNMGVTASMSVSIVVGDRLWGLIACHNYTPRYIAADLRVACELFGQMFSLQLEARIEVEAAERRIAARAIQDALSLVLPADADLAAALADKEANLRVLIPAGGVAVWLGSRLKTVGEVPPPAFIAALVEWLNGLARPVVDTFQLGTRFPPAAPYAAVASGLLAVALSRDPADYVLWFRPEIVHSVSWAGNPNKAVEGGPHGDRLTPRKSFDAWQEEVRSQAAPWDRVDIEVAHAFRVWLMENVLRQMDLARKEREAAFAHQSMLMAELDHRVKNTLASIQAMVSQTKAGANSLDEFALALERRIRAMAHAHNLMATSRWRGALVRGLVEEELAPFRKQADSQIRISGDDLMLSPKAALPFTMAVHELACNAAKYGALSTPAGGIDIGWRREGADGALVVTWQERNGPPVTPPTRRGFGSVVIERGLRHELQGGAVLTFDADGVGCVITVPAEHLVPAAGEGS